MSLHVLNNTLVKRMAHLLTALCFLGVSSPALWALNCAQVRQLSTVYLKMHYSAKNFDDQISQRTLENFIKAWDPGKIYFYDQDIEEFKKKYEKALDDQIMSAQCGAIDDIVKTYGKRFDERAKEVQRLIDLKHEFNIDEFLELDRKKINYAKSSEELNDRWRQRIKFQIMQLKKTINDMAKVKEKIAKRYENDVKRHREETQDMIFARFLNAFAMALDPHSDYMMADELEDFRIATRLSLDGIGAVLRSEDGFTVIQSMVPGGAAAKSGKLKVGDKIIAVAQQNAPPVDVIDMDLRKVVEMIRGKSGSVVKLTVVREKSDQSKELQVELVREKVQLTDRTAKAKIVEVKTSDDAKAPPTRVGTLNLPSFYVDFESQHSKQKNFRSSARDMMEELIRITQQKADALVLDLRINGGGSLTESIKIAGLFLDKGPVVQIKETDGSVSAQNDEDSGALYSGPLVVLISRQSASASEIFAGAIQDYQRGLIVGDDHTFGKGTVQNLQEIGARLGATKVTISKFYRPSGGSTQLNGVASDIVIPSLALEFDIGEKFYDYALPWDKIPSAKYTPLDLVKPYVATLSQRSAARLKSDENFKKLNTEIEEWKKNKDQRTRVNLNENAEKNKTSKDKNMDEEEVLENEDDLNELKLEDDPHMQEAIRIAADYSLMIGKKNLGTSQILGLKPKKKKKAKLSEKNKKTLEPEERKPQELLKNDSNGNPKN